MTLRQFMIRMTALYILLTFFVCLAFHAVDVWVAVSVLEVLTGVAFTWFIETRTTLLPN